MFDDRAKLIGIWKFMSFDAEDQESGERKPYLGDAPPSGYMVLSSEGRMMVLIAGGRRESGQTVEKTGDAPSYHDVLHRTLPISRR